MTFAERIMRPVEPVAVAGWTLKGYHLTLDGAALSPEVVDAASRELAVLLPPVREGQPTHGFYVLHRGEDALWLIVWAWRYADILAVACAGASLSSPTTFAPLDEPLAGCVWELAALVHERSAWVRHTMQPATPDLAAYLRDALPAGPVGAPG